MLEFSADIQGISKAKREATKLLKQKCKCNQDDLVTINTTLDELLFNIVEHSTNGFNTFKLDCKVSDLMIEFYISDCDLISIRSKRVTRITKNDIMQNRKKNNGGNGLSMVENMTDNLEIYKVQKGGNGRAGGYIIKMVKCLNGCAYSPLLESQCVAV